MEDCRESTAAEVKDLRNSRNELRNVVNEMQNKLDGITASIREAEERIGEIEDNIMENDEAEKRRERKLLDHKGRSRDLNDSVKCNNICIIGIPEEEEREKGVEGLFE